MVKGRVQTEIREAQSEGWKSSAKHFISRVSSEGRGWGQGEEMDLESQEKQFRIEIVNNAKGYKDWFLCGVS